MKNYLLLFFIITIARLDLIASHAMGGEITAQNLGGYKYLITAKYYRYLTGPPALTDLYVIISDSNGLYDVIVLPNTSTSILGNSLEERIYSRTYTFLTNGRFKLSYSDCCRSAAIVNIINATNYELYIDCDLFVDSTNSSPMFLNDPIPDAQINVPFYCNPLPYDADGDSLVWHLDSPYDDSGSVIPSYSLPSSDSLMPFAMNSTTGEISFLPNASGVFIASFIVEEYRNGILLGYVRREIQISVKNSLNIPPVTTSNSTNFPYSGLMYSMSPGNSLNATVNCIDPDLNLHTISVVGEPFILQNNYATYTSNTISAGNKVIYISWNTVIAQSRVKPYYFCLRYSDVYGNDIFATDITFIINVNNISGIDQIVSSNLIKNVYPNPSNGNFILEVNSEKKQNARLEIVNMIGQQVKTIQTELNAGLNIVSIQNSNLNSGHYILNIVCDGKISGSMPLEIN
jgi:Secretion system C-terminal sorting domain